MPSATTPPAGPAEASPLSHHPHGTLELAMIGNCTVSALVDARGRVVWCCMPRFDGDPVFHALLGSNTEPDHDGAIAVEIERLQRCEQAYDPGTAIVRTRLFDTSGQGVEITDFAPRFMHHGRIFRPAQLVRRVRPLNGYPRVRIVVRPRGDWGSAAPTITRGSNPLRYMLPAITLRLNTSAPPTYIAEGTWFSLHSPVSLLIGPDETLSGGIDETARDFEEQTTACPRRRWCWACPSAPDIGARAPTTSAAASSSRPGASSGRRSSRASAARSSTPACC
jgi:hypothetical protein